LYGRPGAWPLFETAVTFKSIAPQERKLLLGQIITILDITHANLKDAYRALELFIEQKDDVLWDDTIYRMLVTRLLALSEIEKGSVASSTAAKLRGLVAPNVTDLEKTKAVRNGIVELVRSELEAASPQSLL
jgi:hypothetical protein